MCSEPAVTADGRFVVHVSDRGGTTNLWRVPLEGGTPERITSGPGPDSGPAVAPDGRRIAFVNARADPRIIVVSHTDGSERVVSSLEGGLAWSPVLSPDRSRILLSRKLPGQPWRIQSVPFEGGVPSSVLEGDFGTIWPRFLPDGSRFVFFTWPGRQRVGMVSVEGSGLTWLTDESVEAGYPDVSPDGSALAFVREPGDGQPSEIVVRPLRDGNARVVAENATLPTFSPDGTHLAFSGSRAYTGRIGVVALDTGERRWLTDSGTWPVWLPDGTAIAYADRVESGPQVARVVSMDGTRDEPLNDYRWNGSNYPFSFDPASADLVTTNNLEGAMRIWLAEYDEVVE
jgi:Tol biopolymer transport system component